MSNAYTRDVFGSRDAARLATFDAILTCYPDILTTPRQLAVIVDLIAGGYLASRRLVSLSEFTARRCSRAAGEPPQPVRPPRTWPAGEPNTSRRHRCGNSSAVSTRKNSTREKSCVFTSSSGT